VPHSIFLRASHLAPFLLINLNKQTEPFFAAKQGQMAQALIFKNSTPNHVKNFLQKMHYFN
jgi:hypothetical protein